MSYNVLKLIAHENPFSLRKTAPPLFGLPRTVSFSFSPYLKNARFPTFFVENVPCAVLKLTVCENQDESIVCRVCIGGFLDLPPERSDSANLP